MKFCSYFNNSLTKSDKCGKCLCDSYLISIILIVLIIISNTIIIIHFLNPYKPVENVYNLKQIEEVILFDNAYESEVQNKSCSYWDCMNLYRCSLTGLTVYVYPLSEYVDGVTGQSANTLSTEYFDIIKSVVKSPYYTQNPNDACLLMPSIDLLNGNIIENATLINRALGSLEHWDRGENHILFNMVPGNFQNYDLNEQIKIDRAIVLGAGFDSWTYRSGYDISIPLWTTHHHQMNYKIERDFYSQYLLTFSFQEYKLTNRYNIFKKIATDYPTRVLFLKNCGEGKCNILSPYKQYPYPNNLAQSTFCLIIPNKKRTPPDLLYIMAHKCIPVVFDNEYIFPFEEVIDWSLASIRIRESELHTLINVLNNVTMEKVLEMQKQIGWLYDHYFKDVNTIILAAFEILESRIFPHLARTKRQWNSIDTGEHVSYNPLFLSIIPPKSHGFTAIILTYDRLDSLNSLIRQLAHVPSLQSILVVWNNQKKAPPNISQFSNFNKPIQIIHTLANKLSNRFYPHPQIGTEAVLTIDDDIVMLTADELEFGYEVWREFPDRIVGFPSRVNIWNNETKRWQYESEWTNHVSMVLTGAAFHHKFWNHMYTYSMPGDIKEWVDLHMNCEDIAMNFLVSNITRKPPIKVTPRKKFKCPECTNTEMISADLNHMRERSNCIDRFAHVYGHMPLRSVEFRADPVLYRDNFPDKLKRFNNIGSL